MTETKPPTTCPYCGCQIQSPFPWNKDKVIHDVDACAKKDFNGKNKKRKAKK